MTDEINVPISFSAKNAKSAQNAIAGIEAEVERLNAAFDSAGAESVSAAAKIEAEYEDVTDAIDQATAAQRRLNNEQDKTSTSGARGRLESIDHSGAVAAQVAGGFGGSELGNAVGLVGDVAGAFGSLNPLLGASAVSAGLAAIAIANYSQAIERGNEIVESFADGLVAALQAGSREAIQALIDTEQAKISIAEATRDILIQEAQGAQSDLQAFVENTSTPVLNTAQNVALALAQAIGGGVVLPTEDAIQTASQYTAQISEQNSIINQSTAAVDAYNAVLADESPIVEELLSIEDELRTARHTHAEENKAILAAETAAHLEAEEAAARYADQLEYTAKQTEIAADTAARAAEENLTAVFGRIATSSKDQFDDFADTAARAKADVDEALIDYAEALGAVPEAVKKIESELADQRADITADGEEKRTDILLQAQRERERIERDFARTFNDAVGEREVLAAKNALETREDGLEDQEQALEDNTDKIKREIEKQFAAAEKNAQRLVSLEKQKGDAEVSKRYQVYQQALSALNVAQNAELAIHRQYDEAILATTRNMLQGVQAEFVKTLSNITNAVKGKGGSGSDWRTGQSQLRGIVREELMSAVRGR